jgi:HD superfamily phosphohydrolase YqeK
MSASTHRVITEAAEGLLPEWAVVNRSRLAHVERVAALLEKWAEELALSAGDRVRWKAVGYLHDALREESPERLRALLPAGFTHLSGRLLHGPAAAERLRQDGVDDEPLLCAITYHTIGHPDLDEMGRALFIADYIEPGRKHEAARLAVLRARMPAARVDVLRDVLYARMEILLGEGRSIRSETAAFWNALHSEQQRHAGES